jgi:hypothetical protein
VKLYVSISIHFADMNRSVVERGTTKFYLFLVHARVYKREQEYGGREREYHTPYCCVLTPFAKYRGQTGQNDKR